MTGNTPKPKRVTSNNTTGKKVQTGKVPTRKPVTRKQPYSNQYGSFDGTTFRKRKVTSNGNTR